MGKKKSYRSSLIELLVVMATIVGTTVPLYLHTDNKMNANLQAIQQEIKDFHSEMKNFHGKVCILEEKAKK